jgi:hypothetical protein
LIAGLAGIGFGFATGDSTCAQGTPSFQLDTVPPLMFEAIDGNGSGSQRKSSARITAQTSADARPLTTLPFDFESQVAGFQGNITAVSGAATAIASQGTTANPNQGEPSVSDSQGEKSVAPLQNRDLSNQINVKTIDTTGTIGTGLLPELVQLPNGSGLYPLPTGIDRGATFKCVHWLPSMVCHQPLYFEDAMLERHGQVRYGCLQPMASGAKFFSTIPMLPYLYTLRPKHSMHYTLGHWRPGSCAPLLSDTIPWDKRAAIVESASAAAFFWAVPL